MVCATGGSLKSCPQWPGPNQENIPTVLVDFPSHLFNVFAMHEVPKIYEKTIVFQYLLLSGFSLSWHFLHDMGSDWQNVGQFLMAPYLLLTAFRRLCEVLISTAAAGDRWNQTSFYSCLLFYIISLKKKARRFLLFFFSNELLSVG